MDDDYYTPLPADIVCQRIESLCNVAEVMESITNKEAKKRLLSAMDMLLTTMPGGVAKPAGALVSVK